MLCIMRCVDLCALARRGWKLYDGLYFECRTSSEANGISCTCALKCVPCWLANPHLKKRCGDPARCLPVLCIPAWEACSRVVGCKQALPCSNVAGVKL